MVFVTIDLVNEEEEPDSSDDPEPEAESEPDSSATGSDDSLSADATADGNAGNSNSGEAELETTTEVESECSLGICRFQSLSALFFPLCIHFTTGLIGNFNSVGDNYSGKSITFLGQCSESSTAPVCTPTQLLHCHPTPELAAALLDAFLPDKPGKDKPVVFFPISGTSGSKDNPSSSLADTFIKVESELIKQERALNIR